jgi:hypothetical protein
MAFLRVQGLDAVVQLIGERRGGISARHDFDIDPAFGSRSKVQSGIHLRTGRHSQGEPPVASKGMGQLSTAPRRQIVTFAISTAALNGDDATYAKLEAKLAQLTDARNSIAQRMIDMLEAASFGTKPIDRPKAELLILEAEALVASLH